MCKLSAQDNTERISTTNLQGQLSAAYIGM